MSIIFEKQTDIPIKIEMLPSEDPNLEYEPSFLYKGDRYYLKDFMRTHNNPWIGSKFPDEIDGIDFTFYDSGIAIQWHDDYTVDVYEF